MWIAVPQPVSPSEAIQELIAAELNGPRWVGNKGLQRRADMLNVGVADPRLRMSHPVARLLTELKYEVTDEVHERVIVEIGGGSQGVPSGAPVPHLGERLEVAPEGGALDDLVSDRPEGTSQERREVLRRRRVAAP